MSLPRDKQSPPLAEARSERADEAEDEDDLLLALAEEIEGGEDEENGPRDAAIAPSTASPTTTQQKEHPAPEAAAPAPAPPPRKHQQKQDPFHRPQLLEIGSRATIPAQQRPAPHSPAMSARSLQPFVDLLSRLRVSRPLPMTMTTASSSSFFAPRATTFTSSSSSSALVEACGAEFLRLDQLKSTLSGEARRDGLWATAGVVTFKGERATTAGATRARGSNFRSSSSSSPMVQLVLSDLEGTEAPLSALGARSSDAAEPLALGCVVAVVGATARTRSGGVRSTSSFPLSLSAGDSAILLPLGPSADYGVCGARTRDGGSCRRAVNKSACPVCDLHVSSVASRLRPERRGQGALRDSALASHVLGNRKRRASNGGGYLSSDSNAARAAAASSAADAGLGGLPLAKEAAALQQRDPVAAVALAAAVAARGKATHGVRLLGRNVVGRAVEAESAPLDAERERRRRQQRRRGSGGEEGEEEELLLSCGSEEESGDENDASGGVGGRRRPTTEAGAPSASEAAAAKRRRSDALLKRALDLRSTFDPNRVERSSAAGRAALAKLLASGKERARGGGGGGARAPTAAATAAAAMATTKQQEPRSAFAAAFAAQESALLPRRDSGKSKEATGAFYSRYGDIGEDAVVRGVGVGVGRDDEPRRGGVGLSATLASLEAKDAVEQRAASLTKLVVRAVCCPVCRYTAERPTQPCLARGHAPAPTTAVKRWWKCRACGSRSTTVGTRYPENACRSCRDPSKSFERSSAGGESTAGKCGTVAKGEALAERGAMRARGQEHGFSLLD